MARMNDHVERDGGDEIDLLRIPTGTEIVLEISRLEAGDGADHAAIDNEIEVPATATGDYRLDGRQLRRRFELKERVGAVSELWVTPDKAEDDGGLSQRLRHI